MITKNEQDLLNKRTFTQAGDSANPIFITYSAHLRAYAIYSYLYGTGQSAKRLAERGGFGLNELDAFYPEWRNHIIK